MKTIKIQKFVSVVIGVVLFASCKKDSENIFTMFKDVTIAFNSSDPRCVTDYKVINDRDEVWIDFTLKSESQDMYAFRVETSAGTAEPVLAPAINIPADQRREFNFVYKVPAATLRDGKMTFRILAVNEKGIFIGDGYKKVTVEQNPSYMIFANRDIFLPDTVAKVLPSYFSINDGRTYSYTNGAANSAKIDFGIYRTLYKDSQGNTLFSINLYNTTVPATVFPIYDVSSWIKRATKFSAPITSQGTPFLTAAISGSSIETLAKARTINLNNTAGTTAANGLAPGSAIFFQTPEGKYGMMLINQVTSDLEKRPYINVSVKLQR